MAIAVIES